MPATQAQSPCYPADICPTTTQPFTPTPRLAQTGSNDTVSIVLVGLALLIMGLVILVAIRRRFTLG